MAEVEKNRTNIIKFLSCTVLLLIAYLPTINWMIERWNAKDSYYSHGFLIPLISLFLAWQKKDKLAEAKISSDMRGNVAYYRGAFDTHHLRCP